MPTGKLIELNFNPDKHTLRQFGFIALGGFSALAFCAYREVFVFSAGLSEARIAVTATLALVAALSGMFSVAYPKANRALFIAMSVVSYPIGFVMSYVVLGLLFFAIIAPIGALLRWTGHDPMQRSFDRGKSSYWIAARSKRPKSSYFHQF
jgi:uncharacterized protein YjeT (DUF2065 family)